MTDLRDRAVLTPGSAMSQAEGGQSQGLGPSWLWQAMTWGEGTPL